MLLSDAFFSFLDSLPLKPILFPVLMPKLTRKGEKLESDRRWIYCFFSSVRIQINGKKYVFEVIVSILTWKHKQSILYLFYYTYNSVKYIHFKEHNNLQMTINLVLCQNASFILCFNANKSPGKTECSLVHCPEGTCE